ncbi:hypothetical protein AUEXF2481DRAFT_9050 [Aureobasidium subglaciale EXF-2481]|uniref:Uncharacterized protein n=1 Tax=Aureobasidium subglaciale (strain EXF-2481) TaxID=1043005 RepID=A0A074Y4N9_AURSE|nr:uncharacterized protein AUEXF2481DRAFT_9050 [Aureobasidium subglaciale EXF-2481]KAI5205213.1 hypothetical protein E4T38_04366 [Aureobasidium subglaciale]KAI5224094.1 hypothetical protein E4T40_04142 [Aureobasidium subglaciale]KAI5228288.1 hypothetical protein E4T41_03903 [Aureobasidium subglaciale]KAI5262965.1 hypothetical protein E4T46_04110 [Aureobasidium subglaciale]KEQ90929.1 hypothetical protein AUEXF2481DRAFT_9050 [Aureobasidium subglaciale EXF-2481]
MDGDTYPGKIGFRTTTIDYYTTGQLCDEPFASWWSDPSSAPDRSIEDCSDSLRGLGQIHSNSPFGFDEDFAEVAASQTSSCSQYGYAFTGPGPYALETSTPGSYTLTTSTRTSTELFHASPWSRPSQLPLAPGTLSDCWEYREYAS